MISLRGTIDWALFRQTFEGEGRRVASRLAAPTHRITAEEPGLIGAAVALDDLLRGATRVSEPVAARGRPPQ